jgi:2-C-methyl-D-erythritol 4-phosphate cytidylyltransferase
MKNSIQYPPVTVLIMAAGLGRRLNAATNKIWLELGGVTILERSIRVFLESARVESIVVVAAESEIASIHEFITAKKLDKQSPLHVISGGAERQDSVRNGLEFLRQRLAEKANSRHLVAVHDAARPLLSQAGLTETIEAAQKYGAAGVGVPVKDTIKQVDSAGFIMGSPDRSALWAIQTPQIFDFSLLWDCYQTIDGKGLNFSDDCSVVEYYGRRVKMVSGSYENIKITTPEDLDLAELILKRRKGQK